MIAFAKITIRFKKKQFVEIEFPTWWITFFEIEFFESGVSVRKSGLKISSETSHEIFHKTIVQEAKQYRFVSTTFLMQYRHS